MAAEAQRGKSLIPQVHAAGPQRGSVAGSPLATVLGSLKAGENGLEKAEGGAERRAVRRGGLRTLGHSDRDLADTDVISQEICPLTWTSEEQLGLNTQVPQLSWPLRQLPARAGRALPHGDKDIYQEVSLTHALLSTPQHNFPATLLKPLGVTLGGQALLGHSPAGRERSTGPGGAGSALVS